METLPRFVFSKDIFRIKNREIIFLCVVLEAGNVMTRDDLDTVVQTCNSDCVRFNIVVPFLARRNMFGYYRDEVLLCRGEVLTNERVKLSVYIRLLHPAQFTVQDWFEEPIWDTYGEYSFWLVVGLVTSGVFFSFLDREKMLATAREYEGCLWNSNLETVCCWVTSGFHDELHQKLIVEYREKYKKNSNVCNRAINFNRKCGAT